MKLEITKERVLKAAEKCSDAKNILKELFPEVFKDKIHGKYFKCDAGYIVLGIKETTASSFTGVTISESDSWELGVTKDNWHKDSFDEIDNPFK